MSLRPPDTSGPAALHGHVLRHAAESPDAPAIATPTARVSYAELAQRMLVLAGAFRAQGLAVGDRMVVALPNGPAMVVASLAVQALGATAVEVNRGWGAAPLRDVVRRTGARQVVTWGRDTRMWGDALEGLACDHLWVVHREPLPPALLDSLGRPATWVRNDGHLPTGDGAVPSYGLPAVDPDGAAVILFTSGSTGTPQGVLQTHRNIDANSSSIASYLGLTRDDRVLATLPLYYCYGRSLLQTHLLVGGSVYFDDRFAFPRTVMEALATEGCTGFAGVPLSFEILRRSVDLSTIPMPSAALCHAGGRGDGARHDPMGSRGIRTRTPVPDVRSDGGDRPPHVPAPPPGGRQGGLHRHPDSWRGGACAGRGRIGTAARRAG